MADPSQGRSRNEQEATSYDFLKENLDNVCADHKRDSTKNKSLSKEQNS